jgi:hypothetical protein
MRVFGFVLLATVGVSTVVAAYFVRHRRASGFPLRSTLRAALVIASVRLVVLWSSIYFLRETGDFRQTVAYILIVLNCLVEMTVVGTWRNDLPAWVALLSVLVAGTSVWLGFVWALAAEHFRSNTRGRV